MRPVTDKLLTWTNNLLSIGDQPRPSDLIFVLAGRQARKSYGLELFYRGMAPRLMLSVARFDVRKLAALPLPAPVDLLAYAKPLPVKQRYFFLSFSAHAFEVEKIRKQFWGTLSEIAALADWVERHPETHSIQIVSSGFHLSRVRLCSEALLPRWIKKAYIATPHDSERETLREDRQLRTALIRELLKLLVYWPVVRFRHWRQA